MTGQKNKMKFVFGFMTVFGSLVAAMMPFENQLKQNVERYKYNNFRWNTRNLNQDTFISLRKLEESKDKAFSEYLQQLNNPQYASEVMTYNAQQMRHNKIPQQNAEAMVYNPTQNEKFVRDTYEYPMVMGNHKKIENIDTTGDLQGPIIVDALHELTQDTDPFGKRSHVPAEQLNKKKRSPQVLVYNVQHVPRAVAPQVMMFVDTTKGSFGMVHQTVPSFGGNGFLTDEKTDPIGAATGFWNGDNLQINDSLALSALMAGKRSNTPAQKLDTYAEKSSEWSKLAKSFVKSVPETVDVFFRQWKHTISIFDDKKLSREDFLVQFPGLSIKVLLREIARSSVFEKLFWPFVYKQTFMNQKLGLLGLSGLSVAPEKQKSVFYEVLEKYQTLKIPFTRDRIVYSFNDSDVVEGLNRSGLMETSKEYVDTGLHLFSPKEQTVILQKVDAAMLLINKTMPELYKSIQQVIGCIAFYKGQHAGLTGGTVSSAFGVIWIDPHAYADQSVAYYAEMIVHEFIHSSLFLADLVHGTFADFKLLSRAKVYSPIRYELRDFDKTFHASYVSTGVALFHTRAGNLDRARNLLEPLRTSVDGLVKINKELGVLDDSGNAMLQAMDDFLTLIRLL